MTISVKTKTKYQYIRCIKTMYIRMHTHKKLSSEISSVQFSRSVVSDSLRPHELQHARPPCPSPTPCFLLDACRPTISLQGHKHIPNNGYSHKIIGCNCSYFFNIWLLPESFLTRDIMQKEISIGFCFWSGETGSFHILHILPKFITLADFFLAVPP